MLPVEDIINQAVMQWATTGATARDVDHFHVSDAGLCYRARYYKRLGIQGIKNTPVGAYKKMLAGSAGHEMLQTVLQASGALESSELEVRPFEGVLGHYDAVVKSKEGARALLEFKTIEKWQMKHIREDGPKPEHVLQMKTYWYGLRRHTKFLSQATLVYVMREDFQQVNFNYVWDTDMFTQAQAEWKPLLRHWTDQTLPRCTCDQDYGGNGIRYCRYQDESGDACCDENLIERHQNEVQRTG